MAQALALSLAYCAQPHLEPAPALQHVGIVRQLLGAASVLEAVGPTAETDAEEDDKHQDENNDDDDEPHLLVLPPHLAPQRHSCPAHQHAE